MATKKKELPKIQYGVIDDGDLITFSNTNDLISWLSSIDDGFPDVVVGEYELKRVGKIGNAFVETKSK